MTFIDPMTSLTLTAEGASSGRRDLERAVRDFESLFIYQMLKTMREGVEKSGLFHGGRGEEIYTSMLDMEISREMARGGGLGLAKMLMRELAPAGEDGAQEAPGTGTRGRAAVSGRGRGD
ncbi:MAG TPA: hypothetical protein ENJ37_05635 [Deltaproteobacteria bacterium]|nr:hypothetical protein [Deltaproteobacteria bacterium]